MKQFKLLSETLTVCLLFFCGYIHAQSSDKVAVLTKGSRPIKDPVKVNPGDPVKISASDFEGLVITYVDEELQGPCLDRVPGRLIILDLENLNLSYFSPLREDNSIEVKVDFAQKRVVIPSTVTPPPYYGTYTVTEIAEEAFCDLKLLKSVTIPGSITSIGEHSFRGCKLDTITLCSLQPIVCSDNAFDESTYKNTVLNVPKKWKQRKAAKISSAWGNFRNVRYY